MRLGARGRQGRSTATGVGIKPGSFLEIGRREGRAMAFCSTLGFQVQGFDFGSAWLSRPNPEMIPRPKTENLYELLRESPEQNLKFIVIWMDHRLEHALDP